MIARLGKLGLAAAVLAAALGLLPPTAVAKARLQSACVALSQGPSPAPARVMQASFGDELADDTLRIRYLAHASFALETAGGLLAVTDYTGLLGNPDIVPDVVTMNNAHDTHFTDHPDPRIPVVLRGWGPPGQPARIEVDLGEMLIRNVTTDLRGPFGEGGRQNGNSIFLFEVAGLCIGHLSHLHQVPSPAQYASIGRMDVVMVPVDGGFTMDLKTMAAVVRALHPRIVLPMHWFSDASLAAFLAEMQPDFALQKLATAEVVVARASLPQRPTIIVLSPQLFP